MGDERLMLDRLNEFEILGDELQFAVSRADHRLALTILSRFKVATRRLERALDGLIQPGASPGASSKPGGSKTAPAPGQGLAQAAPPLFRPELDPSEGPAQASTGGRLDPSEVRAFSLSCETCENRQGRLRVHRGLVAGAHCDECWAQLVKEAES